MMIQRRANCLFLSIALLSVGLAGALFAEEPPAVELVASTNNAALAEQIRGLLERDLSCRVVVGSGADISPGAFHGMVSNLYERVQSGGLAVIALVEMPLQDGFEEAIYRSRAVLLLNVSGLCRDMDMTTEEGARTCRTRVTKEVVAGFARLMGLPDCILPRCALRPHKDHAELDAKGGNLCPPCRSRLIRILMERHAYYEAGQPTVPVSVDTK